MSEVYLHSGYSMDPASPFVAQAPSQSGGPNFDPWTTKMVGVIGTNQNAHGWVTTRPGRTGANDVAEKLEDVNGSRLAFETEWKVTLFNNNWWDDGAGIIYGFLNTLQVWVKFGGKINQIIEGGVTYIAGAALCASGTSRNNAIAAYAQLEGDVIAAAS